MRRTLAGHLDGWWLLTRNFNRSVLPFFPLYRPFYSSPYRPSPAESLPSRTGNPPPSLAEQKWLHDRHLAEEEQKAGAAEELQRTKKDFSQPPPPFQSRLGHRNPAPVPPQPAPVKSFCHKDGVSAEFFSPGGTGKYVSENGISNSQKYYTLARPLGGRAKGHTVSVSTPSGYRFSGPLSYAEPPIER
jgi:hypothetical protein